MKIVDSVLELIGNTPMIRLKKIGKNVNANILAKCEFMNPSGSIKDRIALWMIENAEKEGKLKPNGIIVESSTGNTGIALSFVGNVKGYKVKIFLPEEWGPKGYRTEERIKIMECFGAEVIKIPPELKAILRKAKGASGGVVELKGRKMCYEMELSDPKVWWARQVSNLYNVLAHKETTGKEILEQTGGKIDAWVASIGTGGTLLGVSEALKEKIPNVKIFGVEPDVTPLTEWIKSGEIDKILEELGIPKWKGIIETMLEKGILDKIIKVSDKDARSMANRLACEEGLFCGMSSGANVFAALKVAERTW
ncbi:MAG: cysteine synthase family protein [Candidatus Bathyarchaeia archaeon]